MNHRFARHLACIAVSLCVGIAPCAGLTPEDEVAMTGYMETISRGWDQTSCDAANTILIRPQYTQADWEEFFSGYFASHPLTSSLWGYLNYPVFWWFDDDTHLKLQEALSAIARDFIADVLSDHPHDLGPFFESSPETRESIFNWTYLLHSCVSPGAPGYDLNRHFTWLKGTIRAHPDWLTYPPTIDPILHPFVNMLRLQIEANLRDTLPLTAEVIEEIAATLEMTGPAAELWRTHGVLLHDNHFFDGGDLDFWQRFLDSLEPGLVLPANLFVYDALGNTGDRFVWFAADDAINVFAWHVGDLANQHFPQDAGATLLDGAIPMYIHEAIHIVDGTCFADPELQARREALLTDAGADPMNYLRSMLPEGFFLESPQEFVASIGNQYGASTETNFRLGVKRLRVDGRHQPMEQALFLFDLLSRGGPTAPGYEAPAGGEFRIYEIPLERDGQGRILSATMPGGSYTVVYGPDGHVVAVDAPCSLACSTSVPPSAVAGQAVPFTGSASSADCSGTASFQWDFGDGSTPSSQQNPRHSYSAAGSYTWTLTTTLDGATCRASGSIEITQVLPPGITSMQKLGNPFRIRVSGSNLQSGIKVFINGAPWTAIKWKSPSGLLLKSGAALKAAVPKGIPSQFRFVNPDGGEAEFTWQWP